MSNIQQQPATISQTNFFRTLLRSTTTVLACAALMACAAFDRSSEKIAGIVSPYQAEIVQGNFVSREQVALLQAGMSRAQVREILGAPLVSSMFHADRWDYVFAIRRRGTETVNKRLQVFFKDSRFERSVGDEMPSELEFVKTIDNKRELGKVPPLVADEADLNKNSSPVPPIRYLPPPTPKSYPPLEAGV